MDMEKIQAIVNSKLNKNLSHDQLTVGMDYAGFTKTNEGYRVEPNSEFNEEGFDIRSY